MVLWIKKNDEHDHLHNLPEDSTQFETDLEVPVGVSVGM